MRVFTYIHLVSYFFLILDNFQNAYANDNQKLKPIYQNLR